SRWPLVVAIHNVNAADADSRILLAELLREPDAPPFSLVITADAASAGADVALAALPDGARRVHLEPLRERDERACDVESLEGTARRIVLALAVAGRPPRAEG